MRNRHHADIDLRVFLLDRRDVELARLIGSDRLGDEQPAVCGAVVFERRGGDCLFLKKSV
jgi:hypothetical protein